MTAMKAVEERTREAVQRHDRCVPDGRRSVAQLDERGFSKFTRRLNLKKLYDTGFTSAGSRGPNSSRML